MKGYLYPYSWNPPNINSHHLPWNPPESASGFMLSQIASRSFMAHHLGFLWEFLIMAGWTNLPLNARTNPPKRNSRGPFWSGLMVYCIPLVSLSFWAGVTVGGESSKVVKTSSFLWNCCCCWDKIHTYSLCKKVVLYKYIFSLSILYIYCIYRCVYVVKTILILIYFWPGVFSSNQFHVYVVYRLSFLQVAWRSSKIVWVYHTGK